MIHIKEPIWKDRSVGIATYLIQNGDNEFDIEYKEKNGTRVFPGVYVFNAAQVKNNPRMNAGGVELVKVYIQECRRKDMQTIDWEKESANEYQVYPEGTYKITINGYEETTASTGTKQIRWKASILEPKEFIGKPITIHTALTEKSLWKIARLVKGCGVNLKALGKMEIASKAFFGVLDSCIRRTAFWHIVVVQDNRGNDRNDVDDFRVDNEQEIVDVKEDIDDVPDFLKKVEE